MAVFIPAGIWATLDAGPAWDDIYENEVFLTNLHAVLGLFKDDLSDYQKLISLQDRYYGIGFHTIAYLFAHLSSNVLPNWTNLNSAGFFFTLKHIPVFFSFVASGYLVKKIVLSLTGNDNQVANAAMIFFLLWPYVLGHGMINIKDMPFLFGWLLCTYLSLKIFDNLIEGEATQSQKKCFFLLGLASGWLMTIRISGVLIFIEYAALMIVATIYIKLNTTPFRLNLRTVIQNGVIFALPFVTTLFLLYPIFWHDPFELLNAIMYQSHNPITIDTLTAGKLISNRDYLSHYIPLWFGVKLPILTIIGIFAMPAILWRYTKSCNSLTCLRHKTSYLKVITLMLAVCFILFFLIINRVHLYNELRHILFLAPILMIIGLVNLFHLNRYLVLTGATISAIIFAVDAIKLHPYQYTYLNEVIRQFPISTEFEKDYFALSAARTAVWLNQQTANPRACIYASPIHSWINGIDQKKFDCNQNYPGTDLGLQENSFYIYGQIRKTYQGKPIPSCELLHSEKRKLTLTNHSMEMSRLYFCKIGS